MSELVEMSCILMVNEVSLMPELVKMLTKAVTAAYSWDSMTVCVGESEEEAEEGRVIMNLAKSIDAEGYENIVARFHRCRDPVCRHVKGGGKPIGEMRLTRLPEVRLDDLLKAREEESDESGGSGRLQRVISDEMFFPSWFDRLREGSAQSQMAPGDLPLWVPEFPTPSNVPVFDVVQDLSIKRPHLQSDEDGFAEVSKNTLDWGRRDPYSGAERALKNQIQVLKERKEAKEVEEVIRSRCQSKESPSKRRTLTVSPQRRKASPVRSVSDTAVRKHTEDKEWERKGRTHPRRDKDHARRHVKHREKVVEEKRHLFNLGASFRPFLSFYPLGKKKVKPLEGPLELPPPPTTKRSMSSEFGADRRGRRKGRRRRAEERRPPPESSTTECKEPTPRRLRRRAHVH